MSTKIKEGSVNVLRSEMPKVNVDTIRGLARDRGMSVAQLERQLGIAKGYIHKWGEHDVSYHTLKKCADILGVDVERLFG